MPHPIDRAVFAELQATAGADFVVELLDTFFDEAPLMIAELRASLVDGAQGAAGRAAAADRFRRAAHSLKTNAQTFGATALATQARALELGDRPHDAGAIDALQASYEAAVAALEGLQRG